MREQDERWEWVSREIIVITASTYLSRCCGGLVVTSPMDGVGEDLLECGRLEDVIWLQIDAKVLELFFTLSSYGDRVQCRLKAFE